MKAHRVLIVEDEAVVAGLLADLLESMGHGVSAIADTETEAVFAAARCHADMMIVDSRLRDGSGIAAVEQILRISFIPHVFVSGDTLPILARMPTAIVIRKPFLAPELDLAIQSALTAAVAS